MLTSGSQMQSLNVEDRDGGKEGSPLERRKLPQKFHARADAGHIPSAGTPVPALRGPAKYF